MRRIILIALLLFSGSRSFAADRQRVPATELVAAAQAALEAKARDAHLVAHFASVSHVTDLSLPIAGVPDLSADVQDAWLRTRIGVPVQVFVADHRMSSVTVWFSVTVPIQASIYSANYARGTRGSAVHATVGAVDLARTHGASMPSLDADAGQRLHRAVAMGDAVLPGDFETVPAVLAQQLVRIETISGAVRLSTTGRALADGNIGQTITVLPADASQPVRARVVSNQAVTIGN